MHSETFRLGNHPSRHRKKRDDAALLTQEGNSSAFTVTNILSSRSILKDGHCYFLYGRFAEATMVLSVGISFNSGALLLKVRI